MATLSSSQNHFHLLDELANSQTVVHARHPLAKLLTTLAFLVAVASFGKYEAISLLPFILYPVVLIILADLPVGILLKRVMIVSPFALGVGIANPIFDRMPMLVWGSVAISGGWVSLASILLRVGLTVLATLVLVATSGIGQIAAALLQMRLPRSFVAQLVFLYRYIGVLGEETGRMIRAHSLRSLGEKRLPFPLWGSLIGHLLLRTVDRAGRIYHAMLCRGFDGRIRVQRSWPFRAADGFYLFIWVSYFSLARFVNLPELIGSFVLGVGR